uniref:Uncharacterized protein n=1 Tax=Rhizophora mucronata TaxID=61149 RepID=A0A2P2PSX5_RHIMU
MAIGYNWQNFKCLASYFLFLVRNKESERM